MKEDIQMEITRKQIGTTLILSVNGQMDTNSSRIAEEEVRKGLDGVKELYWDFSNLTYLTSAGIRVLLIAESMLENGAVMKVIHANDAVRNAFYLTNPSAMLGEQ